MEQLEYKILLEKYYEAETSLDEEKKLHKYLESYNGDDVDLLEGKHMFGAYFDERTHTVNIDFNDVIKKVPTKKVKLLYGFIYSVAASLLIGLFITVLLNNQNNSVVYAYINGRPITDKQIAMEYSKKALSNISTHLKSGTKGLTYMNKINKPAELLTAVKTSDN